MNIGFNRVDRAFDDQLHADRGRQVVNGVAGVHQFGQHRLVGHRVDVVVKLRIVLEVADIVDAAGGEVVDDVNVFAPAQQLFGEMGTDETGAPGDE